MTDFPDGIVLEARKKGLTQVSTKDGDFYRVSFDIHPNDATSELSKMKLGTRVCLVVTEMAADGDDKPKTTTETEAPKLKGGERAKRAWNELSMPEQAGILVNDIAFAKWLLSTEYEGYGGTVVQDDAKWKKEADAVLKSRCDIESKSALGVREDGSALNSPARGQFIRIEREWRDYQRGWPPVKEQAGE